MYWYHSPFMWHDGWFGWFGWLMPIIGIVVFIFVAFLIYKLLKHIFTASSFHNDTYSETTNKSLKILNERFARGEINEEEYKRLKNIILKG
ncbi:SHOCT domain-containing protein [Thermosipho atlanticus]|uniref:Putative membrane protein n=1 Tax=Thermosipho atlanticus DSM 15807 TaxID=1123380 RepID=A0A1M5RRW4_9BACT|nr:SHOCT domain-containing protein [Thermosipho atlanticus]SHH28899.1 putative membrane protein [Thermosipho atlanticus DSM 15807]